MLSIAPQGLMRTRIRMNEFNLIRFPPPGVSRAAFMSHGGHTTCRHPASRPNELPPVSADSWPETILRCHPGSPRKTVGWHRQAHTIIQHIIAGHSGQPPLLLQDDVPAIIGDHEQNIAPLGHETTGGSAPCGLA